MRFGRQTASDDRLHRHHIDWNHDNNAADNVMIVCQRCHVTLHKAGFLDRDELMILRHKVMERNLSRFQGEGQSGLFWHLLKQHKSDSIPSEHLNGTSPMTIRISGLDENATKASSYGPDSPLRAFQFRLEGFPNHIWAQHFAAANERNFHMRKRNAHVVTDRLIVECTSDELPEQLEIMKKLVSDTNTTYAASEAEQAQEQNRQKQNLELERRKISEIAKEMKFD